MTHWAQWLVVTVLACTALPAPATAEPSDPQTWQLQQGQAALRLRHADGQDSAWVLSRDRATPASGPWRDWATPLGSVWKLFVYAYLVDRGIDAPAYACQGLNPEEVYCCAPGAHVDAEQALVQSCGLFFEPTRLGIGADEWQRYWHARHAPAWLARLPALQPATRVPVAQLLDALAVLPRQDALRELLLDVTLAAPVDVVAAVGAGLRVKTWSWQGGAERPRQGGFAGWLADGAIVWAGGEGGSQAVLQQQALALGSLVGQARARPSQQAAEGEARESCVQVRMFSRYPLETIAGIQGADPPPSQGGALNGHFRLGFANGQTLDIESHGELVASALPAQEGQGRWRIDARLPREDYVARVLEREAAATPVEAARAMAIAIRTYLQQNAVRGLQCLEVDDSSHWQRVAPRPASGAAQAVAHWTRDLTLSGAQVQYHLDEAGAHQLSWQQAVAQARGGMGYTAILAHAYPAASLSRWGRSGAQCEALDAARQWLQWQQPRWREILDPLPGHQEVQGFAVCRLRAGRPHVDRAHRRIFVRGHASLQQRLDLVHEYLHLAFDGHPAGHDEAFVEALARRLVAGAR